MDQGLVEQIRQMYFEVRARVVTNEGRAPDIIPVTEGVKQGCPASPIIFSLLMDRVEDFVAQKLVAEGGLAARG